MKNKTGKQYTPAITRRYLLLMEEVIKDGICKTRNEFAESVGEFQQNISLMRTGKRAPTIELIARTCIKYGYSPTWLILGTGQKKINAHSEKKPDERIADLEVDMLRIKRLLKIKG